MINLLCVTVKKKVHEFVCWNKDREERKSMVLILYMKSLSTYRNDPKFLDRQVRANR